MASDVTVVGCGGLFNTTPTYLAYCVEARPDGGSNRGIQDN